MADGEFHYNDNRLAPAAAFDHIANTFGNITMQTARLNYERWLREQQLGMQQQRLQQQGELNKAQIPYYQSRGKEAEAQASKYASDQELSKQHLYYADALGRAASNLQEAQGPNAQYVTPETLNKLQADMARYQAAAAALYSQGATRMVTPTVVSEGQRAGIVTPGGPALEGRPKMFNLGQGDVLTSETGQTVANNPNVMGGKFGLSPNSVLPWMSGQEKNATEMGVPLSPMYQSAADVVQGAIKQLAAMQAGGQGYGGGGMPAPLPQPPAGPPPPSAQLGSSLAPYLFSPQGPPTQVPIQGLSAQPLSLGNFAPPPMQPSYRPAPEPGPPSGVPMPQPGGSLQNQYYDFMNPSKQQQPPAFSNSAAARKAGLKDGDMFTLPDGSVAKLKKPQ